MATVCYSNIDTQGLFLFNGHHFHAYYRGIKRVSWVMNQDRGKWTAARAQGPYFMSPPRKMAAAAIAATIKAHPELVKVVPW